MKRVYVASPLSALSIHDIEANARFARLLCEIAMREAEVAAFASHGFFPLFLDDCVEDDRRLGVEAGLVWLDAADELWVYTRRGVSKGMATEIEAAAARGIPVIHDPDCWRGVEQ